MQQTLNKTNNTKKQTEHWFCVILLFEIKSIEPIKLIFNKITNKNRKNKINKTN
jgi:hypothetical protein